MTDATQQEYEATLHTYLSQHALVNVHNKRYACTAPSPTQSVIGTLAQGGG